MSIANSHALSRPLAEASVVAASEIVDIRSVHFCGTRMRMALPSTASMTRDRTFRLDLTANARSTRASPTKPPRENVNIIEVIPMGTPSQNSSRSLREPSVFATHTIMGNAIFMASAKSLLSAIIECGGPNTVYCPPETIEKIAVLNARNKKMPAVTRYHQRRRVRSVTSAMLTNVMNKVFETLLKARIVLAKW